MASERHSGLIPISAIRIDLEQGAVILEAAQEPVARLVFNSGSIFFQTTSVGPAEVLITAEEESSNSPGPTDDAGAEETEQKERPVVFSGRLKSRPRQGKPDSQGHPTAWAMLAVHEEGRDDAHMFSTTFHRASARIALNLPVDAQVRVEGYPHPSNDPEGKRLDTLSVFRFLTLPGQPETGAG